MEKIKQLANELISKGIRSYYVGGCVRDELLGIASDDIDICLVGVKELHIVDDILSRHCESVTPLVGQKFPVLIGTIDGVKYDFAMARRETLTGGTRRDFEFETDDVTIVEDLRRRDFTINAIAKDVLTGEWFDPFNGRIDLLDAMILHPTSSAFKEDTLRVYRAARFLARFPFLLPSPLLRSECASLSPTDISPERVGLEFYKAMQQAEKPSEFFMFLKGIRWLKHHFRELENLIATPQSPTHHPEGDAFIHTMLCLDQAKDWFTRVCMVCHDLGKSTMTTIEFDGRIKSIGHEKAGVKMTRDMLQRIHFIDRRTIRQVETMVELHMIRNGASEKVIRTTLRRLMEKHLTYDQLVEVCRCDVSGRPPKLPYTPDIGQQRAKYLVENGMMIPIVTGEKLLKLGYESGKLMGHLIKKGLEWQDRGSLTEENWEKMIGQYKPDPSLII